MNNPAPCRDHYPSPELEQALTQGENLGPGTGCTRSSQTYFLHQDVSRSREQNAKLVGPKAGATGAINFQVVQLFEAVFNVATLAVHPFVNPLRTLCHVGNHEAGIVFGIFFRRPDDFRLDHHPASMRSFSSCVIRFSVDMFRFSAAFCQLTSATNSRSRDPLQ